MLLIWQEVDILESNQTNHPNILKLIVVLKTSMRFYCVYELIEGKEPELSLEKKDLKKIITGDLYSISTVKDGKD